MPSMVFRRVKPGHEALYDGSLEQIIAAASAYPGHLGVEVFRPRDTAPASTAPSIASTRPSTLYPERLGTAALSTSRRGLSRAYDQALHRHARFQPKLSLSDVNGKAEVPEHALDVGTRVRKAPVRLQPVVGR